MNNFIPDFWEGNETLHLQARDKANFGIARVLIVPVPEMLHKVTRDNFKTGFKSQLLRIPNQKVVCGGSGMSTVQPMLSAPPSEQ